MADAPKSEGSEAPIDAGSLAPSTADATTPAKTAMDAPLLAPGASKVLPLDALVEQIITELEDGNDLTTPEGWTNALRALAARREVLRRVVRDLVNEVNHPKTFRDTLRLVIENGIGKPLERHEHLHRGTVNHKHTAPPIAWTDDPKPPPPISATATMITEAAVPTAAPPSTPKAD